MATYTAQCSAIGGFGYAGNFKLYVILNDRDGSSDTNKSYVDYNVYCQANGSGSINATHLKYFNIDGKDVINSNVNVNVKSPNAYIEIAKGTIEVPHDSDGTRSISFSARIQGTTYGVSAFISGTFVLTTIPRASSVGATSAYIEESTIININRASSNFTHTLTYSFHNLTGTIAEKTVNTSVNWTLPTSFYAQIPNQKSSSATITCITYNGNNEIGRSTCTFTVNTNEEKCKPSLSATVIDINETTINLTGSNTKLIKYKSTAKVTITTSSKNSASINSKKVNNSVVEGNSISILNVEADTFVVTVTDSRGYTNSVVLKPTVINYIPLTINANIKRVQPTTGEVGIQFSGNYFNGNFGSTNNTLNINWYYKEKNQNDWINGGTLTTVINENTYSNGTSIISLGNIFNYQKEYDFYLAISDKLMQLQPNYKITEGEPIFYWEKGFVDILGVLKIKGINILELIFPIGSTYVTQTNTNPNNILGFGTWERLKAKVCLGLDEEDTNMNEIGKTGGEKMHTLTVQETATHEHSVSMPSNPNEGSISGNGYFTSGGGNTGWKYNFDIASNSSGGGQPHNNMQPFEIVGYMWIRRS